jgi:hypothetical protein
MTLAPPPPHALPRPGAHLAPHRMCMCAPPFDSAESKLLVRRQQAAHALHPAKLRVKIGSSVARGSHRATIFDHHNIESVGRRLLYDCIRPVLAPVKVLGVCVRKLLDTHVHTMMLFDFLLGLSVSLASCAMAPCPLPVGDERSRRTHAVCESYVDCASLLVAPAMVNDNTTISIKQARFNPSEVITQPP